MVKSVLGFWGFFVVFKSNQNGFLGPQIHKGKKMSSDI